MGKKVFAGIGRVLQEIDSAERKRLPDIHAPHLRMGIVLAVVAITLISIHYLKNSSSLRELIGWWASVSGDRAAVAVLKFRTHLFAELMNYAWWGLWAVLGYVLLPVIAIRYLLKERVADYWVGRGELSRHWYWYLLLLAPIVVFAYLASFRQDFLDHYPFYRLATRSWFDLLAWEAIYLTQFVCLEFFFRGFMLRSLSPIIGVNAVFVMCVPYMMIHFPKPWLEATGAILFGFFLGVLAMRTRSIWGGVAVHAGVALSMDFAAIARKGGLPENWWPG